MIKDTCLQRVDALPPQTLDLGSWYTARFLLARTNRKEKHTKTITVHQTFSKYCTK